MCFAGRLVNTAGLEPATTGLKARAREPLCIRVQYDNSTLMSSRRNVADQYGIEPHSADLESAAVPDGPALSARVPPQPKHEVGEPIVIRER